MAKQYSIAQARDRLPSIVHEVEDGQPVELTRRGKTVAFLLSARDYRRVAGKPGFSAALEKWRAEHDVERLDFTDEDFADLRDRSPGRDFRR